MKLWTLPLLAALATGCGPKVGINETRTMFAPSLPADCPLKLVEVDITSVEFNQTWDVLGYVTLMDTGTQDPAAAGNRALVRPRACAMGGSSVAVAANSASSNMMGTGSGLVYMVLRPKAWKQAPQAF